jgi:hypothetical protein
MSDEVERNIIVLGADDDLGANAARIRRTSWVVPCATCGQRCYQSSGSDLYAPGYRPECVRCFERAIGRERARFYMRRVFRARLEAHARGQCSPGTCPILGCPRGPREVN